MRLFRRHPKYIPVQTADRLADLVSPTTNAVTEYRWQKITPFAAASGWDGYRELGIITLVDSAGKDRRWMWTVFLAEDCMETTGWAATAEEAAAEVELRYNRYGKCCADMPVSES